MKRIQEINLKTYSSLLLLVFLFASIFLVADQLPEHRPSQVPSPAIAQSTITIDADYSGEWASGNTCIDYLSGLRVGRGSGEVNPDTMRVYIRFPLSALPSSADIVGVDLILYQYIERGSASWDIQAYDQNGQADPGADSCASRGTRAANDPSPYINNYSYVVGLPATHQLPGEAYTHIANAKVAVGRFSIGLNENGSAAGADNFGNIYSHLMADKSKLRITYNPPPPPCSNECSPSGAKQCAGNTAYQTCGNYDADSCLEWSSATSCPTGQTCSGGSCTSSEPPKPKPPGPKPPGPSPAGSLTTLQLTISVPHLIGQMKIPVKIGSLSKEIEVSPDKKDYQLDVKEANISIGSPLTIVIGGNKTLIKKINAKAESESMAVAVGDLVLGDITSDNKIDDKDAVSLLTSITNQTLTGDLNADKTTNSLDWAIILANFGKSGDF